MDRRFDAIVIGAGGLGASVTYHLARHGLRVALCDARAPASQTTARAAGLAMQIHADDALTDVCVRSHRMLMRLGQETGRSIILHASGSIKIARRAEDVPQLESEIARGLRAGVVVERIERGEAERLHPLLKLDRVAAMWHSPHDLYFDPTALPRVYIEAAAALGATVMAHTEVTGVIRSRGSVAGVRTAGGALEAPAVVDAAGAWAAAVAAAAGVTIPLVATTHQRCLTARVAGVREDLPTVRIIDAKFNMRPEGDRLAVGGFVPAPRQLRRDEVTSSIDLDSLHFDRAALRVKMDSVADVVPVLAGLAIEAVVGGLITMTPDGYYIASDAAELPGFFVLAGCNSGGLSTSPALGADLADWIARGRRPAELEPFSLGRFPAGLALDEEELRARCLATYLGKYSEAEVGPVAG